MTGHLEEPGWPGQDPSTSAAGTPPPPGGPIPSAPPPQPGYGYGALSQAVPPGMYFDPESGLTLPSGVQLASVGRRIGAYFLAIPLAIVTLGIGYAVWGLVIWGRGQTPALQVLGMRCWHPQTNRVPGWGRMALREIVGRFVEGLLGLITELISFVVMLTNRERRCLHDMIAGTVVLHDPHKVLAAPGVV